MQAHAAQIPILDTAILSIANILARMDAQDCHEHPREGNRSNLKDPDTFDGEELEKLQEFLAQCGLHFAECPATFASDNSRITFVMSGTSQKIRSYRSRQRCRNLNHFPSYEIL